MTLLNKLKAKLDIAVLLLIGLWKTRRCKKRGLWCVVWGKLIIEGDVRLGERVRIRGTHVPVELGAYPGAVVEIGDRTFINSGVSIGAQTSVKIGANCAIGNYSLIMDSDFHSVEDHTKPGIGLPVVIEDNVWLGARVTVLKGVRIGRGAVVAAGAVVTRDVPARAVVAGVPARVIRMLDSTQTREKENAT